jgi:prolyl 4-hydroxylase
MNKKDWSAIPLVNKDISSDVYKIETNKVQFYCVPNFLTAGECEQVIAAINSGLIPSEVTTDESYWRTSRTCHLPEVASILAEALDIRLSNLTGIDKSYAESIQGQRYDPGEYFKEHHDWFDPDCESYQECCAVGGQRTWTAMVYLNDVEEGGETDFPYLDLTVKPECGLALIWNNLDLDNKPNEFTLHESLPVKKGSKYIITKWYREEPGCLID